ncbi:MAG: DUF6777 domain-containing protein [Candidatus Nanopelagicales bacterium]
MSEPQYWDGQRWLHWDGTAWVPLPDPPPPPADTTAESPPADAVVPPIGYPPPARKSHAGAIIASVAVALVFVLLLAGGALWMVTRGDDTTQATDEVTSITTVPINGTQASFTDPVGTDQQITARTTQQPVTVAGGEPGLYGGTRNVSSCDRGQLIDFLMANPDKGRVWAGVLGTEYDQIPTYVMKLTPLLLRSDTLVMNHGYVDGQATAFPSVLQAGTAVLAGRRGLPVVRCFCGNPLTEPSALVPQAIFTGPTWPGWNPQSITVIVKNTTLMDIFIVVDPATGERFIRPAGTAGGQDSATGSKPTTGPTQGTNTDTQVADVTGFLNAVMAGDYGAADSYCTGGFISRFGGAGNLAVGWGSLNDFRITGAHTGDSFVAVYVEEYWEGGFRASTYYVTKTGGTYIDDADFVDTPWATEDPYTEEPYTEEPYTEEPYTEEPYTEEPYTEEPYDYPSDYPEQYPDDFTDPGDDAVG